MKIQILKSCSGYSFSFKQGDTTEVGDVIGNDLVHCGFAKRIDTESENTVKKAETTLQASRTSGKSKRTTRSTKEDAEDVTNNAAT